MAKGGGRDPRENFSIDRTRYNVRSTDPDKAADTDTVELYFKHQRPRKINDQGVNEFIDDRVGITGNDNYPGFLKDKLIAGTGVTLTELNDGQYETFRISVNNTVGSSRHVIAFGRVGVSATVYLEFFRSISSFDTPYVVAENSEVVAFSVASSLVSTATFSIRKNGVEIDTISLSASKTAIKTPVSHILSPLDQISVYVSAGSAKDPILSISSKVLLP